MRASTSGDPIQGSGRFRGLIAPAVLALGIGLLCMGDPAPAQDSDSPAQRALLRADSLFHAGSSDRALAVLDSLDQRARAARDTRLELATNVMEAGILSLLDRPQDAEPRARRAVVLASARGDSLRLSHALRWLAKSLAAQQRPGEAASHWRRLLAVSRARGDREHEAYARLGIAYVDAMEDRVAPARDGYRRAARLFHESGLAYWEAWALTALGRLEHGAGDLRAARACHIEAANVSREGGVREYEAHARNNIGALDYLQGDPGRALEAFREARRVQREIGQHRGALIAAHNEAISLRDLGRFDDASALLDSALTEARARGYTDLVVSVLLEQGESRRRQGRLGESAALLREALGMGSAAAPQERMEAALSLAATLGERDSAAAGISALEDLARSLWPRLPAETRAETDHVVGFRLYHQGRLRDALERLGRADQTAAAAGIGRDRIGPLTWMAVCERGLGDWGRARAHLAQAASVWEEERAQAHDPEWRERYGFLVRDLAFETARSCLADPAIALERRAEAAFDAVQPFKSRTLWERMLGPGGGSRHGAGPVAVGLDSLRSVLAEGDVYLEGIEGADGIVLLAVTRSSARGVTLADSSSNLPRRLARLSRLCAVPPRDGAVDARALEAATRAIGGELLGPVTDLVAAARRVILSPDGVLCRIPLASLGVPGEGETGSLIDGAEVAWTPSATVYYRLRRRERSGRVSESPPDAALLVLEGERDTGRLLRGARAEAQWLTRSFAGAERRTRGTPVTVADLAGFTALHFASHSEVDDQYPWRSGIRVGAQEGASESGWLRAADIAPSHLDARMAVLASCQSAGGPIISGEGVIGLTGAFLSAGVPAVVATLWPVDDRATARLMRTFYAGLSDGLTASAALRRAQQALRREPGTEHPFYWAGFVLVGDPDITLPLTRRRGPGAGILLGASVLVALLGGMWVAGARRRVGRGVTNGRPPSLTQ